MKTNRTTLAVSVLLLAGALAFLIWSIIDKGWVSLLWFALGFAIITGIQSLMRWAERRDRRKAGDDDGEQFRRAFTDPT